MEHPNFHIENSVLAELHKTAAGVANTAEPLGPFVGAWWEIYLAEVIRAAQAELYSAEREKTDREKNELAAENARLREQIALLSAKMEALTPAVTPEPTGAVQAASAVVHVERAEPDTKAAPSSFIIDPVKGVEAFNPFKKD